MTHSSLVLSKQQKNPKIFNFIPKKPQIITLEKLEPLIFGIFGFNHYFDDCLFMKMVAGALIFVSIKNLINQLNVSPITPLINPVVCTPINLFYTPLHQEAVHCSCKKQTKQNSQPTLIFRCWTLHLYNQIKCSFWILPEKNETPFTLGKNEAADTENLSTSVCACVFVRSCYLLLHITLQCIPFPTCADLSYLSLH